MEFVGFEVLTAAVMKASIFWDIRVYTVEKHRTFQTNVPSGSSGLKNKPNKKPA
jgi:hypothetical protein